MKMIQRISARPVSLRIHLLATLFSLPNILNVLVGLDWTSVLPAGCEGYGARIGAALTLARLVLPATQKNIADAARTMSPRPGERPDGGPH